MGRAPCCDKANVKKGPWSPEEDSKLKHYIHNYGTGGNWISLPHKAGLKRCGKSCRLRWLNYLRPNIKHGEFTEDEDRIICTLFANIGSRWSIIAAQLPDRTDNDIKNYWNTKLKKKLLMMSPTIPPPQPLLYSSSLLHPLKYPPTPSLAYPTTTHTSHLTSFMDPTNNLLVFGTQDHPSCSSSENGSHYSQASRDQAIAIKQDHHHENQEMGFLQSFISNNGLQERSSLGYINDVSSSHEQWSTTTTGVEQKEKGYVFDEDIERLKELISSNSYGGIDENKVDDYDKSKVMDMLHQYYY